jgi:hypothetical protein
MVYCFSLLSSQLICSAASHKRGESPLVIYLVRIQGCQDFAGLQDLAAFEPTLKLRSWTVSGLPGMQAQSSDMHGAVKDGT